MKKQATCRCDAYPFPHRKDGGKCDRDTRNEALTPEERFNEAADYYFFHKNDR